MTKRKVGILFGLLLVSTGCATTAGALETVMERAPFDLDCDAAKVRVKELSGSGMGSIHTVGASGCGRKAVYLVQYNGWGSYTAALNSPTGESKKDK